MKALEQRLWEKKWQDLQDEHLTQNLDTLNIYSPEEPWNHLDTWDSEEEEEPETKEHYCKRVQAQTEQTGMAELGMYGLERKNFLKQYKPEEYQRMLDDLSLLRYLVETNAVAENREARLVYQMETAQGVTEDLKMQDQMKWVGMENNIINSAREIVRNELIYA